MARPAAQGYGLRRDLELLEALTGEQASRLGGVGVVRLAEITGRDKSQVSRALRALEVEGVVERDPDTLGYQLGSRLFALAARGAEQRLLQVAGPAMRELCSEVGETVHLCKLRGDRVLTLLTVAPGLAFRAADWEGRETPAHCTSAGRVLLLDASEQEVAERFAGGWPQDTARPTAVRTAADLWERIREAWERGFAMVDEEFEPGLVGVSAPVRDFRGRVVAALNISAPKDRLGDHLPESGRRAVTAADRVSAQLGWELGPGGRGPIRPS
nr:IclR family transcriptional regulator [Streptomyces sp. NBC_00830]